MDLSRLNYVYLLLFIVTLNFISTYSAPSYYQPMYNDIDDQPDEFLIDLIARYGQTIMNARNDLENSKRTVDFGLSRGYSGAQEAKHRMAMQIANFAGGPGRRKRLSPGKFATQV
ncbi:unnamed protein product [Chironomus riparius]|uniref:Diuretic hormone 31 n=1 Tax=Chironomus riparius TaxID=315576 RepID=A0A9N9WSK2_9DIPT|nr:unnamed protein product [Chironomus riparius]